MICDICGQEGANIRHVTRSYGKKTNLLIIENVPVISCPHCRNSYLVPERKLSKADISSGARNLSILLILKFKISPFGRNDKK
ncbi:MAG: YgiT-type zinc finger protein [Desulfobacteraceae bacterium]|nr:YgiT-type zinc finger protein [Desulfobacteraceae bacterium]